jgi:hypothetical protein
MKAILQVRRRAHDRFKLLFSELLDVLNLDHDEITFPGKLPDNPARYGPNIVQCTKIVN